MKRVVLDIAFAEESTRAREIYDFAAACKAESLTTYPSSMRLEDCHHDTGEPCVMLASDEWGEE